MASKTVYECNDLRSYIGDFLIEVRPERRQSVLDEIIQLGEWWSNYMEAEDSLINPSVVSDYYDDLAADMYADILADDPYAFF
jgi:hypothetical protein